MKRYLANFKNCLQKEVPFCQAECPFHVNELDFIEKLRRGSFKAAFKDYRNAVGFPRIVSALCHAPCSGVCPRRETDEAIHLHALERACIEYAGDTDPADYNLPKKTGKIGIIGGGISGLACALRLATKKYDVVLYEKSGRVGGRLWDEISPEVFLADIEQQFKFEKYDLRIFNEITNLEQISEEKFNAIYVATGENGRDFGLLGEPEPCRLFGDTGVFAGGSLLGKSTVYAIADGLAMSTTIDNFLKTGNLIYTKDSNATAMCLEPSHLVYAEPVAPSSEDGVFTKDEAAAEANRCIECKCDACRLHCDLTDFFNKWPLRIRDEVQATTLPGSAEVKATPAKRLIHTCTGCGLCAETCPEDIDLGGLIMAARKSMHRQKKTMWAFHDFWLRDMAFANGEFAALAKPPAGSEHCRYAFFPGCQLGASDPSLVTDTYACLTTKEPSIGLMLSCCGIPAEWSGDDEAFEKAIAQVEESWKALGKPTLLLACPTCERTFKKSLPHIPTAFVYEMMAEWGVDVPVSADMMEQSESVHASFGADGSAASTGENVYSVFDPCSVRDKVSLRAAVRKLAENSGVTLAPLTSQEAHSHCCGYGGQVSIANPEFMGFIVKKRISEGDRPYITYCINCRDIFLQGGKESVHILDILFGKSAPVKLPTVSERRDNRVHLKKAALKEFWGEDMETKKSDYGFTLIVSDALKAKLDEQRILDEEIMNVIDFCEGSGRTVYNAETDTHAGYRQIGHMTFWAEYRKVSDGEIELINGYSHRMSIELEAVWNGKKVDLDVR